MASKDNLDNQSDPEETFSLFCSPCKRQGRTTAADKYCADCHDYYCLECVKVHDNFPVLSGHKVLDKGYFKTESSKTIPIVPTERCERHSFKPVDMYCQNHDDVGCYTSMAVEHRYKQRMTDADSTNVCSQCGKTFRQRRNLRTHEKSHAGTFPFTCCDRGFRSRRDLDRHRCREHDLTKNYVCLTCNKTFATSSDLKAHERRENNQRVFSCDICGHRAATRFELTEHMRSHADSRSLACTQCGAMYKHRSSLNRHIKQRHGKE